MNRRDLLKSFGAVALYGCLPTVMSEFVIFSSAAEKIKPQFFLANEFAVLESIIDIVLPRTKTPGGLDAQVPVFIDLAVKDCFNAGDQKLIQNGLRDFGNAGGKSFLKSSETEKTMFVKSLDEKAFKNDAGSLWWRIVKKLALIGYFTSRDGVTKAQNYLKVPGAFEGCIPYKKGDKAMAKTFLIY